MGREYEEIIKSAFSDEFDEISDRGVRPVIFDIIAPDGVTSMLPDGHRLVLHVNPKSMSISMTKQIERIQTLGGWVEQHWGDVPGEISFEAATGGFMRLYTGLSNVTGPSHHNDRLPEKLKAMDTGGTRRETIAYDKYLDLLALFHCNGMLYDADGNVISQGKIKISFDGHHFFGWFTNFTVQEEAEQPYQFNMSASFSVEKSHHELKSFPVHADDWALGLKK